MSHHSLSPWKLWALTSLVALLPLPVAGQAIYGSVVGTVTDPSGAAIPGAVVTVTNNGTSEKRTAESGADGNYRVVNLVPGNYKIEVEKAGFKGYTRDQIGLDVESVVRIDAPLEVGEATQTVEVTAQAPLLQTENASLSQVVGARSVQELPLNGRNVLNLISLVPGVVMQGGGTDGSPTGKNVFIGGNYSIGGGTQGQSAMYYDGIPLNITYGYLIGLNPTQDAVSEFRVQTNNNTAEYGRYTGGVVNMASKSGTNDFHGSAYEFLRNRVLNAQTFFSNKNGQPKASFTQNQYGFNLGGPVIKDKLFFFGSWEGYASRQGVAFNYTVPTPAELTGNFSGQATIYDPLTQCNTSLPACSSSTVQRTPFPNNQIPSSRINPVAQNYINFPYWGLPNVPGQQNGTILNYFTNAVTGGNNNQLNFRTDYNVSDKQHILARYTRLDSEGLQVPIFSNEPNPALRLYTSDPYSPEMYITTQAVLADTYIFSANKVLDVRAGFMRWFYHRTPGTLGMNIPGVLGFPSYYNQIGALDGVAGVQEIPSLSISSPTVNSVGTGRIIGYDDTITLSPTFTWIKGHHSIKFGAELHQNALNYYQNNTSGGTFSFDNLITSQNALNSGATGSGFASFLLGDPNNSSKVQISPFTYTTLYYQGYFVSDTWQATSKLTVTAGLRWEIPGVYVERYNRQSTFNPTEQNPALTGVTVLGNPVLGAFDLVDTPNHPERGLNPEDYKLFAPRLGVAYRLTDKTVLRAGGGTFFIPSTVQFVPLLNPVTYYNNFMVSSIDKSVTQVNTLSDPYPGGLQGFPGRNPNYQLELLGASLNGGFSVGPSLQYEPYGYTYQWNFTVQHQFPLGIAVEAGYAGLRGLHLPLMNAQNGFQLNQLNPVYFSMGSQLNQQVANPFYGIIPVGNLSAPTVLLGQLLSPFPEYQGLQDTQSRTGDSTYHSLQAKVEKRFGSGGTILGAYTFSKVISNVDNAPSEDSSGATSTIQNYYNLREDAKSLGDFDTRHRLIISYVYDLPLGKGKAFASNVSGIADKLVSGWGVDGTTLFQMGFPLVFTATPNVTGFNTGLRPNVAANCQKAIGGSVQSRLNEYYNTACFSLPAPFTFGSEARTDPTLRTPGIANYNLALFKRTPINERFTLEFRAESFNLFNRVQFGPPNNAFTTAPGSTFGQITTQVNTPRLIQLSLRLLF